MWHCECLLCHLVTLPDMQAWHTITLLCFKATQTWLNSAQDPEFSFQIAFWICFHSQNPALVKPKLKSIETMRLPPGLPHRRRNQTLQTLCTKPVGRTGVLLPPSCKGNVFQLHSHLLWPQGRQGPR